MKSSIKYSKIISDICPGIIILIILYYNIPNIYTVHNVESISNSLLSFGFIIFISIFIGKFANLLGYMGQRYFIRKINYLLMSKIRSPYYKRHWFLIKIDDFNDYQKLKIIKLLVQNHPSTQHDFDNDESVKRLMRTTTFIIMLLVFFILYNKLNLEIIITTYQTIWLILLLLSAYIYFLLITCFVYIYIYYKYIEQAIIITKTNFIPSINSKNNFVCNSEILDELIKALYSSYSNIKKEKYENIIEKGGAEIEE